MALGQIMTTGTNLNTPLTTDLQTASNLYNVEAPSNASSSIIGDVLSFIGNTIKISVQALLKGIMSVIGFATDLIGSVKDAILGFISSLVGRDMGGNSKLSLMERSNLGNESSGGDCNFDLGSFGFNGFNLSLLGYSLAALLAMLLCKGISGIFSLLKGLVNGGVATASVVNSAVSDVFSNVTGGNTVGLVTDLHSSGYGSGLSQNVNNSEGMLFNILQKDTTTLDANTLVSGGRMENGRLINGDGMTNKYSSLSTSMDNIAPNWLSDGKEFNVGKVKGNNTITGLSSQDLLSRESKPLLSSSDYTSRTLSNQEKISLSSLFS